VADDSTLPGAGALYIDTRTDFKNVASSPEYAKARSEP